MAYQAVIPLKWEINTVIIPICPSSLPNENFQATSKEREPRWSLMGSLS